MPHSQRHSTRLRSLLFITGVCASALAATLSAPAQDIIVNSDTSIGTRISIAANATRSYLVNDGYTLTFSAISAANGGAINIAAGASLTLGPNPGEPLGTGLIVFRDNRTTGNGGAIQNTNAALQITNAQFINNAVIATGAAYYGGAIANNSANAILTLANVEFTGNCADDSGALRNVSGTTSGAHLLFDGNYTVYAAITGANGGHAGAFGQTNAGAFATFTDAVFVNNRALLNGGAVWRSNGDIVLNNPVFTNNWAGQYGGAIFGINITINITASDGVTDYLYSGNRAGGVATTTLAEATDNAPLFTPSAAAGGFHYLAGPATYNIGAGASLTIGETSATNRAVDSIGSWGNTAGTLTKTGAGDLILNADNSGYIGIVTISDGRLILGNPEAKLGGRITVNSGATFGGAGVIEGRNQSGALQTTTFLDLQAGSILQVGASPASAQTLAVSGSLIINAGVTLDFDLFGGTSSDRLTATTLNVLGTGTLRLGTIASGTYDLASWGAGTAFNAANWGANILADVPAGRSFTTALSIQSGTTLQLIATLDNFSLAWTGAAGALWDSTQENWTSTGGVTQFLTGDTVVFDQTGANRNITVAATGVLIKDMTVTGAADYSFTGGAVTAATGTLFKTGAGTLTLGNSANSFARISLGGGRLAISSAAQIGGNRLGLVSFAASATSRLVITDDITFSAAAAVNRLAVTGAGTDGGILVADGRTLTIAGATAGAGGGGGAGTAGAALNVAAGASFEIAPTGAAGSGMVVFRDNSVNFTSFGAGAVFNAGTLSITNARFINNASDTEGSYGGAVVSNGAPAALTLSNVEFTGNHSANSGALRNALGRLTGENLLFDGNYTVSLTSGNGGAFGQTNADTLATLTDAVFVNNRALLDGGAIWLSNGDATLTNPVFTGNWAGNQGGAIFAGVRPVIINITADGAVTDYLYSGNFAGGSATAATLGEAVSGNALFTPSAAAGGFLYLTSGAATFNIGAGASLTIGETNAVDRAVDSIGSWGNAAGQIIKTGAGDLILNADNSGYLGSTTVSAGRLILGNPEAKLGGKITVLSGATFGGAGVLEGRNQTGVLQTTTALDLLAGSTLLVGADSAAAQTLTVGGTLKAVGATLSFSIFSGTASQLNVATLDAASAGNTINVESFIAGTYILGDGIAGLAGSSLALRGDDISVGSRQTGSLSVADTTKLQLTLAADDSRALTWTGAASGTWAGTGSNWSGAALPSGLFADGDQITFGSAAAARSVGISAAGVNVAEMIVDATGAYTFTGGAIQADGAYVNGSVLTTGTSGKLFKNNTGTLIFQNAANTFRGGIALNAGAIEFSSGAQLSVGSGAALVFAGGTLRPLATTTLSSGIEIAAGVSAVLDVGNGLTLTFNGASSGADAASTLVKTGAGSLLLSGAAALGHGATRIDDGYVLLRNIASPSTLAHTFDFAGGWLDLSDIAGPADGSTANDWAGLVLTGNNGGVIGANDKITLGAGDTAFGIGSETDGAKRGVFVVVDAGAGGVARLTGANFYAGNTRVLSGVLEVSSNAQLGEASANREVVLDGGALALTSAFASPRALEIRASGGEVGVAAGSASWSGEISGGTLIKTGGGELLLSGTNTHASTEIAGGVIAIGSADALGAGGMRAAGAGAGLRVAAGGLQIANDIALDSALSIEPSGNAVEFTGVISGAGALAISGPGSVTLAGANAFSQLTVGGGARLVSGNMRALGGNGSAVAVGAGSALEIAAVNTFAKSIDINNGTLVFANVAAMPLNASMLRISSGGEFSLANSSTIALTGAPLVTGRAYSLAHPIDSTVTFSIGADTVFDPGVQNAGVRIFAPGIDAVTGDLVISGINESVAPGKDVAALFDALGAAAGAINARISESFFFDAADRAAGAPTRHLWLRGFGSYGDYDARGGSISHRDTTYGVLVGMEHDFADTLLVGVYGGHANTTVKTGNHAETDARQPLGGLYAAVRSGVFQATADVMVGVVTADTTRPEGAGIARGSYKAGALSGGASLGVTLGLWEGGFAQPAVSARYTRLNYKDQRENAAAPGAVAIDDFTSERWQGLAGVRVMQRFVTPWQRPGVGSVLLGRRFAIDKRRVTARGVLLESGAAFSDVCDPAAADGFTAGLGLVTALGGRSSLALRYECELSNIHTRHDASVTIGLSW